MSTKFHSFTELNASKEDWVIRCRVFRIWKVTSGDKSWMPSAIEMILVDDKV